MSYDPLHPTTVSSAQSVDAGLQSYMQTIYRVMGLGLALTGVTAFAVANVPALFSLIFGTPLAFVAMLAPLGFIWFGFSPARIARKQPSEIKTTFALFSVAMGLSMAAIFQVFTGISIARVFFITAGAFAATSLYGYTTKKDLTGFGSFLFMGLVGLVIAGLVNIFLKSSGLHFVTSVLGVLIFTGLTAWDVQRLKESYAPGNAVANEKLAVMGALSLYLNFINLFQTLLQFFGDRRQ